METRFDRGPLKRPERNGGALVVEGYAARVHKPGDPLQYPHGNEFRDLEELKRIVKQLPGKPVVLPHPPKLIKRGAKPKIIGRVDAAWIDGELAAVRVRVDDADAQSQVDAGTHELSLGYETDVDHMDHQRDTDVDHLAIVKHARCGDACALRTDQRQDCGGSTCSCQAGMPTSKPIERRTDGWGIGKLTSAVNGHQHLLSFTDWQGQEVRSGETSYALSEGADESHSHPWVRNADGTLTIGEAEGHSHALLDDNRFAAPRADEQTRANGRAESGTMADKTDKQRADELETTVETLTTRIKTLEADITGGVKAAETEALRKEKERADKADDAVRKLQERYDAAVRARVTLVTQAQAVLGREVRLDDLNDRQIHETVIKRLDASVNVSGENDDQVRGRYNTLLTLSARNDESKARIAEILGRTHEDPQRKDTAESFEDHEKNRWKKTLSKGRDAAAEGR